MDIKTLFLKEQNSYIRKIQFKTILLLTILSLGFITFFPKNYGFVILLLFFLYFVANEYIKVVDNTSSDWNKQTYYKLMSLQRIMDKYVSNQISKKRVPVQLRNSIFERHKLNSLYIDSDLIHFFDSVKNLEEYNPDEFFLLLKGTNNILLIRRQMQEYYNKNGYFSENLIENIEIAFELRTNCINNIHNFVYTIPKTNTLRNYHYSIIERYTLLVNRQLDILYDYKNKHNKITGINTNSKLHYSNLTRQTKPYDSMTTNQFYY